MHIPTSQKQMSESFWTITFLTLSGGFQDAYTYFARGKVFANAATGNVVLMAAELFDGNLHGFIHYLIPLIFFAAGIAVAQLIHLKYHHHHSFHWRQLIVTIEILLLMITPFIHMDLLANSLVSFACAMQVQSFRKVHGLPVNSTMTIANIRNAVEHTITAVELKDRTRLPKAASYLRIVTTFFLGAGLGKMAVDFLGVYAIWGSCLLLCGALTIMFFHPHVLGMETGSKHGQ